MKWTNEQNFYQLEQNFYQLAKTWYTTQRRYL